MSVSAAIQALLDLATNINDNVKQSNTLTETLDSQLKTLGSSFQDEGFTIIQNHIATTRKKIEEAQPALRDIIKKLHENAILLKKSENFIRERSR
jgi:uncharacterized protein YukE